MKIILFIVLNDVNNLEQYYLDCFKFIYSYIGNIINFNKTGAQYYTNSNAKIVYEPNNIKSRDTLAFSKSHAI